MIVEDQSEVAAFLADPANHGAGAGVVRRIDTHGAMVFLAGTRAYKLKRAVKFDYMDFSTVERRGAMCEAEVTVNRRTAPGIYLGALPITRENGGLAFAGEGEVVDWVVEMRRFDEDTLFDRLATRGELTPDHMRVLAEEIAAFHQDAERRGDLGGAEAMRGVVKIDSDALASFRTTVFPAEDVDALAEATDAELVRRTDLLDDRGRAGFVRHLHGDLHLRNICLVEGRPTLFDAIEFNDALAVCDLWYDFAFLLMDMGYRGLPELASTVFNEYLGRTGEYQGLALLPFFLSCRAAVRAHVGATAADSQPDERAARTARGEAQIYLSQARRFLVPPKAQLVAVGGLSGVGKSVLAQRLAHAVGAPPGAVVLRTDVLRKRLLGADPMGHLGDRAYTKEMSGRVYKEMFARAAEIVRAGHSVILDAVFLRSDERAAAAAAAQQNGAAFAGVWLHAPVDVLETRLAGRRNDASDATVAILHKQMERGTGTIEWSVIEANGIAEDVLAEVSRHLKVSP